MRRSQPVWPIYQLKITLRGTRPPIWRRIHVASTTTLSELHDLLQAVMGWSDSHLHQFVKGRTLYGIPHPDVDISYVPEDSVQLLDVLRKPKDKILYEYDFGDSWEHDVVLERALHSDPEVVYPFCLAGRGACPPEDCGGVGGFYHLLHVLRDQLHPEHDDLAGWVGSRFDPEAFNVDEINRDIQPKRRTMRRRV